MDHVTVDFESRSSVQLTGSQSRGSDVYARHYSTEIFCMAFNDRAPTALWIDPYFYAIVRPYLYTTWFPQYHIYTDLRQLVYQWYTQKRTFEAHNASFEISMWKHKLYPHFCDYEIPLEQWYCSAAKAAAMALPRALGGVTEVLDLKVKKNVLGKSLIQTLSKPKKASKKLLKHLTDNGCVQLGPAKFRNPITGLNFYTYNETPEKLIQLFDYCVQDVDAEIEVSKNTRDLNPTEQKLWWLDRIINSRGFSADIHTAKNIIDLIKVSDTDLLVEVKKLTGLESTNQTKALRCWLKVRGTDLPDLKKETVSTALKAETDPLNKRVLEIRAILSKSSTAKYDALLRGVYKDLRFRESILYCAASTGRFGGRRVQPQNMVRKKFKNYESVINLVNSNFQEFLEPLYGNIRAIASKLMRNMIEAGPGMDLIAADYASIEGRFLAWLAGEETTLDHYRAKRDIYCVFASQLHPASYEEIKAGYENNIPEFDLMRYEGKTGELACGFQGSHNAILNFAPDMERNRRKEIVKIWRGNRPLTVQFWGDLNQAAVNAIKYGTLETVGYLKFAKVGNCLCLKLPSGRVLYYHFPEIKTQRMYCYYVGPGTDGELDLEYSHLSNMAGPYTRWPKKDFETVTISYWGVDSTTGKWVRKHIYGGKFSENATQAVARDFMIEAFFRLEAAGYPIVLHVHDEIVAEILKTFGSIEEFIYLMCISPDWAVGCPVEASGWRGERYRKD